MSIQSYLRTPAAIAFSAAVGYYALGYVFGSNSKPTAEDESTDTTRSVTDNDGFVVLEPTDKERQEVILSHREKILRITDRVFPNHLEQKFVYSSEELQQIPVLSTSRTVNFDLFNSLFHPIQTTPENWHSKLMHRYDAQNNPTVALQVAAVMHQLSAPMSAFACKPEEDVGLDGRVIEVGHIEFYECSRDKDIVFTIKYDAVELKDIAFYNSNRHVKVHYPQGGKVHCTVVTKYSREE